MPEKAGTGLQRSNTSLASLRVVLHSSRVFTVHSSSVDLKCIHWLLLFQLLDARWAIYSAYVR